MPDSCPACGTHFAAAGPGISGRRRYPNCGYELPVSAEERVETIQTRPAKAVLGSPSPPFDVVDDVDDIRDCERDEVHGFA